MVVYKGSFGGRSSSPLNINVATDIKAKTEEAEDRAKKAGQNLQQLARRDDAHVAQWSAAGRMTDKSRQHDLENWSKFWGGMEKLTGAIIDHKKREKDEDIEEARLKANFFEQDYEKARANDEVFKTLHDKSLWSVETEKKMLGMGIRQEFINEWKTWNQHHKWGFRLGILQSKGTQFDAGLETFIEASKTDQKQFTEFQDGQPKSFTVTEDTWKLLPDSKRRIVVDQYLQDQKKELDTQGFNDALVYKHWGAGMIKSRDAYLKKASNEAVIEGAYQEKEGYQKLITTEIIAVQNGASPELLETYVGDYVNRLDAVYATLEERDELGNKRANEAKLEDFNTFLKDITQDMDPKHLAAWEDTIKKVFTKQRKDLPAGWKRLEDSNKLNWRDIKIWSVERQNKIHDTKQDGILNKVREAVNTKQNELDEAYKANGKGAEHTPGALLKSATRIVNSVEGAKGHKEAITAAMDLATWEPQTYSNVDSTKKLQRSFDSEGYLPYAGSLVRVDGEILEGAQKERNIYTRPTTWGEGHDKDQVTTTLSTLDSAIDPGKKPGLFSTTMANAKGDTQAVKINVRREAMLRAQLVQIKAFNDSGQQEWMSDNDALQQVVPSMIEEITKGRVSNTIAGGRWQNINGVWQNLQAATTVDDRFLNPAERVLKSVRMELAAGKSRKAILKMDLFKDNENALKLVDGEPGYTVQNAALLLGISPLELRQRAVAKQLEEFFPEKGEGADFKETPEAEEVVKAIGGYRSTADSQLNYMKARVPNKVEADRILSKINGFPISSMLYSMVLNHSGPGKIEITPEVFQEAYTTEVTNGKNPYQAIWNIMYRFYGEDATQKAPQIIQMLNKSGAFMPLGDFPVNTTGVGSS